jgi:[ribosomal protein S5]-alanine N-acetyltransferase
VPIDSSDSADSSDPGPSVPTIAAARMDLVSLSPALMEAALAGDRAGAEALLGSRLPDPWLEETRGLFRMRLEQMRKDPSEQAWLTRAMVLRDPESTVIGHIGFHGPPDARGRVEVGYTVLEGYRRQGYAGEAVRALFDWVATTHGITRFIASVGPWNDPSLGLIRKLGFVQTGVQWDDVDGEELVFELHRPVHPGAT